MGKTSSQVYEEDRVLVRKTLAGERDAFGELTEHYRGLVFSLIMETVRRPDAVEDLVQEVFCKAYEELVRLRDPAQFAAWLMRIASNKARDWLRRQQRHKRMEQADPILALYDRPGTSPMLHLECQEINIMLWGAIDRMSPEIRRVVILYYFEDCSYREIARLLDISVPTVSYRLAQARRQLKQILLRH